MTNVTLKGTPDAGNPHAAPTPSYGGTDRFNEGEVAPTKPKRGSLLHRKLLSVLMIVAALTAGAEAMPFWYGGTEPATNRSPATVAIRASATDFEAQGSFSLESPAFELWTFPVGFLLFWR